MLLVHGWGTNLCHFRHLIDAIVAAGYTAAAFDAPAHGGSGGSLLDIRIFADAIEHVCSMTGPVFAAIGHSFGAAALTVHAKYRAPVFERLCLMACPLSVSWLCDDYSSRHRLGHRTAIRFREMVLARGGSYRPYFDVDEALVGCSSELLIVHDQDDPVIPYAHAQAVVSSRPGCAQLTTKGRGHSGILSAPAVIEQVSAFVSKRAATREALSR